MCPKALPYAWWDCPRLTLIMWTHINAHYTDPHTPKQPQRRRIPPHHPQPPPTLKTYSQRPQLKPLLKVKFVDMRVHIPFATTPEPVHGARHVIQPVPGDVGVDHGCANVGVTEQSLNGSQVHAVFE